jgi:hypothetical protein
VFARRYRVTDDRGAIAVLAALVVVTLLFPLVALAVTAHVREGAAAELQRAAEAGALAGAASIPLGNLSFLNAYVAGTPLNGFFGPGVPDPLTIACDQARAAIAADGSMNDAFSPAGTTLPPNFCKAEYLPDATILSRLGTCLTSLPLGGLLALLIKPVFDLLFSQTKTILPGLLNGGVKVTLTRTVRGPFDSLIGGGATAQVGKAAAKRRFKNAVVLPGLGAGGSINLNPFLGQAVDAATDLVRAVDSALSAVLNLVGLGGCTGMLSLLADDLGDLIDPPTSGPTVGQVVDDALATGEQLLVLRIPSSPPLPILSAPYYDLVSVCLSKAGTSITGAVQNPVPVGNAVGCLANGAGIFRSTLVPVGP